MWRSIFKKIILFLMLVNVVKALHCDRLEEKNDQILKKRYVSIQGKLKNISLYWNGDNSRAAAALLAVFLKHRMGYQGVYLEEKPHESLQKNNVLLMVTDPSQVPDLLLNLEDKNETYCPNPIGWGLKAFYVHIAEKYQNQMHCLNATNWSFYDNETALKDCGFDLRDVSEQKKHIYARTSISPDSNEEDIAAAFAPNSWPFDYKGINCMGILEKLGMSTQSFLFFDNIWLENSDISKLSSCKPITNTDEDKNNFVRIHIANASLLLEYAPSIYQLGNLVIPFEYINKILEKENTTKNIENAACEWTMDNLSIVKNWTQKIPYVKQYSILNFYDSNDIDSDAYIKLANKVTDEVKKRNLFKYISELVIYSYDIDATNIDIVNDIINNFMTDNTTCLTHTRQQLLGAVMGMNNISSVIQAIDNINLPILLYDNDGVDIKSKRSIWHTSGTTFHLTLALQHFVFDMNWTSIAVLSEPTEIAQNFFEDLKELKGFAIQNYNAQSKFSQLEANKLLQELKTKSERIIFLNINYEDALVILSAAENHQMNKDYVWITRDWLHDIKTFNLKHINLSFLGRNRKYVEDDISWQHISKPMKEILWPQDNRPTKAPAMMDAILTLGRGFNTVFHKYPQTYHDVHSELAIKEFEKSLVEDKIIGVTQNLVYEKERHSLQNIVVILEEWDGEQMEFLAKYKIYTTARVVIVEKTGHQYFKYANVSDSVITQCLVYKDNTQPIICYDLYIYSIIGALIILLTLGLTWKCVSRSTYNRIQV